MPSRETLSGLKQYSFLVVGGVPDVSRALSRLGWLAINLIFSWIIKAFKLLVFYCCFLRVKIVSVRPTHLPNSSIKGDGVRVFLADAIVLNVRISMRQRSSYPKPFKVQVVQECLQPGATVSSVAIRHGINANVIRKWLPLYRDQLPAVLSAFVPLRATPKRPTAASVIIELSLGEQSVTVKWPVSDPDGCARFVRGLAP